MQLIDAKDTAPVILPGCAVRSDPGASAQGAKRKRSLSKTQYVEGILKGDRSVLAQAITLVESCRPADSELAEQIIEDCLPHSGNSIRVGVTGVSGAGKSSLIEALGRHVITECGEKVAVLAIDPSSQVSGGSILGDKTRMPFLTSHKHAFIRPTPSRGMHGGVAQRTREAILLCEAGGFNVVFVETVGVGQSEVAVRSMVDFFLLITLSGAGDELQGIKRGVMEMADVVAVNKADGDNINAAERARTDAEYALHFMPRSHSDWAPRAILCSAHTGRGVAELWSSILGHSRATKVNGWFQHNRREQNRRWMLEHLERGLMQMFQSDATIQQRLPGLELDVVEGRATAVGAARKLLNLFMGKH
jgi:LAO/AO transport system kinase